MNQQGIIAVIDKLLSTYHDENARRLLPCYFAHDLCMEWLCHRYTWRYYIEMCPLKIHNKLT
jgi:hypothetical protein